MKKAKLFEIISKTILDCIVVLLALAFLLFAFSVHWAIGILVTLVCASLCSDALADYYKKRGK